MAMIALKAPDIEVRVVDMNAARIAAWNFGLAVSKHIHVLERAIMDGRRRVTLLPNLRGSLAVFRLEKKSRS